MAISKLKFLTRATALASLSAFLILSFNVIGEKGSKPKLMTVKVDGHGKDIIFLPGLGVSSLTWGDAPDVLKAHFRVHTVEISGFAGKPKERLDDENFISDLSFELIDYIRSKKLSDPIVIGHSMGGAVGLLAASQKGTPIKGLLVVDALPFYSLTFDESASVDKIRPMAENIRERFRTMRKPELNAEAQASLARLVKNEKGRELVAKNTADSNSALLGEVVYELMTTDLRPKLDEIKIPVSIIYAYDDSMMINARQVNGFYERAYSGLQDKKLFAVSGSLHFIMLDQPYKFMLAVNCSIKWMGEHVKTLGRERYEQCQL